MESALDEYEQRDSTDPQAGVVGTPLLPNNTTSVANENARIVKAGPGRLFGCQGYSARTSQQFILFFDAGTIPANGAIPKFQVVVGASSNYSVSFGTVGRAFDRGIVICNSTTQQTLTLGSADTWIDAQFV